MILGKIYKIVSDSTDKIYIGSTSRTLAERLELHETTYEKWVNCGFGKRRRHLFIWYR